MGKQPPNEDTQTVFLRLDHEGYSPAVKTLKHKRGVLAMHVDYIHDTMRISFNPKVLSLEEIKDHLQLERP